MLRSLKKQDFESDQTYLRSSSYRYVLVCCQYSLCRFTWPQDNVILSKNVDNEVAPLETHLNSEN